ncbi:ATP synthase [Gracilaria domingensis]|nr:ATP synthase [Gracilaria domingensis]
MVQYWRAAGMTYLKYSTTCAELVRQALKEPIRSQVLNRAGYAMIRGDWDKGKIVQRSKWFLHCIASRLNSSVAFRRQMARVISTMRLLTREKLIEHRVVIAFRFGFLHRLQLPLALIEPGASADVAAAVAK